MITHLGSAALGERLSAVERMVISAVPTAAMLVIHADVLTAPPPAGGTPAWRLVPAGTDPEALVERAFLAEWEALRNGAANRLTDAVGGWLDDNSVARALIRSERGCGFGTAVAAGRADILRALSEVRAAAVYDGVRSAVPAALLITRLSETGVIQVREPGADRGVDAHGRESSMKPGMQRSLWISAGDSLLFVDSGGPDVDPHDPWGALYEDPLERQVAAGRAFNRVRRAKTPFEWVPLLANDGAEIRRFEDDCELRYPGVARRLLTEATKALVAEDESQHHQQAGEPETSSARPAAAGSTSGQVAGTRGSHGPVQEAGSLREPGRLREPGPSQKSGPLRARQLVGSPGRHGVAAGIVSRVPRPDGKAVLLCDSVSSELAGVRSGFVAIVERLGCGFGRGAVLSHRLGVPHVYRLEDAHLVGEGVHAVVDGGLGTVTLTSQP